MYAIPRDIVIDGRKGCSCRGSWLRTIRNLLIIWYTALNTGSFNDLPICHHNPADVDDLNSNCMMSLKMVYILRLKLERGSWPDFVFEDASNDEKYSGVLRAARLTTFEANSTYIYVSANASRCLRKGTLDTGWLSIAFRNPDYFPNYKTGGQPTIEYELGDPCSDGNAAEGEGSEPMSWFCWIWEGWRR